MAVGFALANSILLEGPEGLVIVDVTESIESAAEILKVFRNVTDKPIKALIYTHNHADHSYGAKVCILTSKEVQCRKLSWYVLTHF